MKCCIVPNAELCTVPGSKNFRIERDPNHASIGSFHFATNIAFVLRLNCSIHGFCLDLLYSFAAAGR